MCRTPGTVEGCGGQGPLGPGSHPPGPGRGAPAPQPQSAVPMFPREEVGGSTCPASALSAPRPGLPGCASLALPLGREAARRSGGEALASSLAEHPASRLLPAPTWGGGDPGRGRRQQGASSAGFGLIGGGVSGSALGFRIRSFLRRGPSFPAAPPFPSFLLRLLEYE